MNPLIVELRKLGPISPEIEQEIQERTKFATRKKGDYFLKKGQTVSNMFVLETGCVRGFYNKEAKEINTWFGFENELLGSFLPLFSNIPSYENIQFLEDATLYYIAANDLNALYSKHQQLNTVGRKMAEYYCKILEERIASLQVETAEERYISLLRDYPQALQRITLGHIASYLGISQETLSRIRKR